MRFDELVRSIREGVKLDLPGSEAMGTWFLGPRGENEELMTRLIDAAVQDHAIARKIAYPRDPVWVNRETDAYRQAAAEMEAELLAMTRRLARYSIPWYSYRYHAHMNWDNSLPSVVGYIAALLYNQNNVAGEGSPVTTALEMEVAADLCRMVGYLPASAGAAEPWGHITCGGSIANSEAMWACRNLKLYPFAVQRALRELDAKHHGFAVSVTGGGRKRLLDLNGWELLNLVPDEILALPKRLESEEGLRKEQLVGIDEYSVQRLGLARYAREFDDEHGGGMIERLAFIAPASCHYSMPKAATLIGIGIDNLVYIDIDLDARMSVAHLAETLRGRLERGDPVAAVIAVIGSTQEGAVDPLREILDLRETMRAEGLDFPIHADAAWGGYFASLLRAPHEGSPAARLLAAAESSLVGILSLEPGDPRIGPLLALWQLTHGGQFLPRESDAHEALVVVPEMGLSKYVETQLTALREADSVTIDPHKSGFAPYPAGALCYRNREMPEMVAYTAPIVYHDGDAPTVGVFGIEGSKPGAAAAAVWLSHRMIRPDQSGYGRILGRCIINSKRLGAAIATMLSDRFVIATLQRLDPADAALLATLTSLDNRQFWEELKDHARKAELFRAFGSDLLINTYAVNPILRDGTVNTDPELADALNLCVFRRLSLEYEGDDWPPVVLTGSVYDPVVTGQPFVDEFRGRLGIPPAEGRTMRYLVSTTADPWLTDARGGEVNMVPVIVSAMRRVIEEEAEKLI